MRQIALILWASFLLAGCATDKPESATSLPTAEQTPLPKPDRPTISAEQKKLEAVFLDYPWNLDQSAVINEFAKIHIAVDWNKPMMGNFFAWADLRGGAPEDVKKRVRDYIYARLQSIREIFTSGKAAGLDIQKIFFTRDKGEMTLERGVLAVPRWAMNRVENIVTFFSNMQKLKADAQAKTDGVFIRPSLLGLVGKTRFDDLVRVVESFRTALYPKMRESLLRHKAIIDSVEVGELNDSVAPFEYLNKSQKLKINVKNIQSGDCIGDLDKYFASMEEIPLFFRDNVEVMSDVDFLYDESTRTLTRSYGSTLEGLKALKRRTSEVQNASVKAVHFVGCIASSDELQHCGKKTNDVLEVPVAETRGAPHYELVKSLSADQIEAQLLKLLNP
jgi:hypothetical protein